MRATIFKSGLGLILSIAATVVQAQVATRPVSVTTTTTGKASETTAIQEDPGVLYGTPAAFEVTRPAIPASRGVYISQIGDRHTATVDQSTSVAFARVMQDGDEQRATVTQRGNAIGYALAAQSGAGNTIAIDQSGTDGGGSTVYSVQTGRGNVTNVSQYSVAGAENGAILQQTGTGNQLALTQEGSDNAAMLTQSGDANVMTAAQTGEGNRLIWTQTGNNLSNLAITQTGRGALQITQTR